MRSMLKGITACEHRRMRRQRPGGCCLGARVACCLCRKGIDIGGRGPCVAVATQMVRTDRVEYQENNVGQPAVGLHRPPWIRACCKGGGRHACEKCSAIHCLCHFDSLAQPRSRHIDRNHCTSLSVSSSKDAANLQTETPSRHMSQHQQPAVYHGARHFRTPDLVPIDNRRSALLFTYSVLYIVVSDLHYTT